MSSVPVLLTLTTYFIVSPVFASEFSSPPTRAFNSVSITAPFPVVKDILSNLTLSETPVTASV